MFKSQSAERALMFINVQKSKREARLNVPSLVKLGCGSEEQNESFLTFILLFAHLALTLFPNK